MARFQGKIGVIGAGALGAFYGARLARAGADVCFLFRGDYEAVRERGLMVHSIDGDFHLRPQIARDAAELGPCDLLLIGLKAFHNAALPALLAPTVTPRTLVLTLQNGLGNEEAIARTLTRLEHPAAGEGEISPAAAARTIGGVAFLGSNRIAPGVIQHTAYGWLRLARFNGPADETLRSIAELFRGAGVEAEVFDSLRFIRWSKLVWNVPYNGLGVAAAADTRVIMDDPELRAITRGLMEEVVAIAAAEGAQIEPGFIDHMLESPTNWGLTAPRCRWITNRAARSNWKRCSASRCAARAAPGSPRRDGNALRPRAPPDRAARRRRAPAARFALRRGANFTSGVS
jgi:2-dehydropantoate 2-reductase